MDGVNAADDAMKLLRAQTGRQTLGDRAGDIVGASAAGTVGGVANVLSTARRILGDEDVSYDLADTAAEGSRDFTRSAKAGLGKIGSFAVDTGIAGATLLGDAAANVLVPGSGLALSGVRNFGNAAREARYDGASLGQQTAYGLGAAAAGMLTEKLGNTGLLKSAYGAGWLDGETLGTLGRLALSAVGEGVEEFAEGAAQPLLKNLTYDPTAVYDDDWLRDTLYDTAVGAALGALGGAADTHAKQRMSMADFTDVSSPVWNNLNYADSTARADAMQRTHREMMDSGSIVEIPKAEIEKAKNFFPDLRGMKKAERAPILRERIGMLKADLTNLLKGISAKPVEFTVNGNVLEAKLYSTGIREVMEKLTQEKATMLYGTSEIFRNARYMYGTPDKADDPNIYRWNYFYTPVRMGDSVVGVRIAVRDMKQTEKSRPESQIYNWGIKTDASLDGGSPG